MCVGGGGCTLSVFITGFGERGPIGHDGLSDRATDHVICPLQYGLTPGRTSVVLIETDPWGP